MEQLLLTVDEARAVLGLSRSSFYELLSSGDIRSVKIGARRRIPADALRDYVEQLTRI